MTDRIVLSTPDAFPHRRLDLVLIEERDAKATLPWINDAEVTRTLGRDSIMTLESQQAWIKALYTRHNDCTFGIWLRHEEKLIGTTGLHAINRQSGFATFGLLIGDKAEWHKGYATEAVMQVLHYAFTRAALRKVVLDVLSHNPYGKRAYETCGFREIGHYKRHDFRNGEYRDRIVMEVFCEEWLPIFEQMSR